MWFVWSAKLHNLQHYFQHHQRLTFPVLPLVTQTHISFAHNIQHLWSWFHPESNSKLTANTHVSKTIVAENRGHNLPHLKCQRTNNGLFWGWDLVCCFFSHWPTWKFHNEHAVRLHPETEPDPWRLEPGPENPQLFHSTGVPPQYYASFHRKENTWNLPCICHKRRQILNRSAASLYGVSWRKQYEIWRFASTHTVVAKLLDHEKVSLNFRQTLGAEAEVPSSSWKITWPFLAELFLLVFETNVVSRIEGYILVGLGPPSLRVLDQPQSVTLSTVFSKNWHSERPAVFRSREQPVSFCPHELIDFSWADWSWMSSFSECVETLLRFLDSWTWRSRSSHGDRVVPFAEYERAVGPGSFKNQISTAWHFDQSKSSAFCWSYMDAKVTCQKNKRTKLTLRWTFFTSFLILSRTFLFQDSRCILFQSSHFVRLTSHTIHTSHISQDFCTAPLCSIISHRSLSSHQHFQKHRPAAALSSSNLHLWTAGQGSWLFITTCK